MKREWKRGWIVIVILAAAGCSQNMEEVSTGERLEDAPPVVAARERPLAVPAVFDQASTGAEEDDAPPFVKAYFMHTWVEALYSVPANRNPNPNWASPLLDPVNGRVWCTDCHVSDQINFENIPKQRVPLVDQYENDRDFMAGLMRKWVGRLNSDEFGAKAKLRGTVTCLTCHETNPAP
jgi:hypothetical protein